MKKKKNDLIFTCDVPVGLKFLHPLNRLLIGRPKNDPVVQISYNKILALNPSCHNYPRFSRPNFFSRMFKLSNFLTCLRTVQLVWFRTYRKVKIEGNLPIESSNTYSNRSLFVF